MKFLSQQYSILPLDEAVHRMYDGTLPPYSLAVTFDDGYRNNFDNAFPVLQSNTVPATIFIATDFVFNLKPLWVDRLEYVMEHSNGTLAEKCVRDDLLRRRFKMLSDDEKEQNLSALEKNYGKSLFLDTDERYAPLSSENIKKMLTSGITFGAHTVSHPILSRLSQEEARQEILISRDLLRNTYGDISSVFAYPNGQENDWTPEIEKILDAEDFIGALTTISGTNDAFSPRFALKRISMDNTDDWDSFIAAESGFRGILQNLWKLFHK